MTRTTISSTKVKPFSLYTFFFFTKPHHFTHRMGLLYHTAPVFYHTNLVHFAAQTQQNVFFWLFRRTCQWFRLRDAMACIGLMENRQTSTSAAGCEAQMPLTPITRGSVRMNGT